MSDNTPPAEPSGTRTGILEKLGLHRPELRAWAMYDWANSAMVTIIITAVFPVFFRQVASAGASDAVKSSRFGLATLASIIVIALLSPVLGAIADYAAAKKRLLGLFMIVGVTSVGAMSLIQQGQWFLAVALFFLANVGATGSFTFYDALLPHIARGREADRVSTAGYALGYIGGGIVLTLALFMISKPGWFGLASALQATQVSFLVTGIWWLIFSIPLFLRVSEPPAQASPADVGSPLRIAFGRLARTLRELRRYREAFLLLIAFLIYNDGIGTVIRVAAVYGEQREFNETIMYAAIVITQFVGIPFAFLFGLMAGWIGTRRAILLGLAAYVGITLLGTVMANEWHFLALAICVGMVQGGTQALSRSLFASLIPRHKSGEFFGFFGTVEKFSGSIGSAMVLIVFANSTKGLLVVAAFFVVGALLLMLVNIGKGQALALREEAEAAALPAAAAGVENP